MAVGAATALTEGYRVQSAQVAGKASVAAATAFNTLLDPSDLDASFTVYAAAMARIVNGSRAQASALGGAYYLAHREASGIIGKVPAVAWQGPVTPVALSTSLLVTGPVAVKRALSQGVPLAQALKSAETQTVGAVFRHTANAGRITIAGTALRDPKAVGWARMTDGRPCAFCAMLASRGAVYKSANTAGLAHDTMKYHDKCGCFVVPMYSKDAPLPGIGGDLMDLWDSTRDANGNTNFARFKAAYDEAYPKGSNPGQTLAAALQSSAEKELAARAAKITDAVEAAAAAKAAKIEAKWKGKPAPVAPTAPVKPVTGAKPAAEAWDPWLAKVTARYDALGTGKPFTQSYNYSYVKKVTDPTVARGLTKDALLNLKSGKYIDDALYQEALDLLDAAANPSAEALAAYEKALRSYKNLSTRHKRYLAEWREANGVVGGQLTGMDDALQHLSNDDGVDWADRSLPVATGAERQAVQAYTGSSYQPWNADLRAAGEGELPSTSYYRESTALADAAMQPIPEAVLVRRGTFFDEFEFPTVGRVADKYSIPPPDPKDLIGTVQTQYGYMSTSVGKRAAFAGNPVNMDLKLPAGHRAAWARPYSSFRAENELLLSRKTRFFIHDVYADESGKWIVEAEVLPEGVDPASLAGHPTLPRTLDARPRLDPKYLQ